MSSPNKLPARSQVVLGSFLLQEPASVSCPLAGAPQQREAQVEEDLFASEMPSRVSGWCCTKLDARKRRACPTEVANVTFLLLQTCPVVQMYYKTLILHGETEESYYLKRWLYWYPCVPQMAKKPWPCRDVHISLLNNRKADHRNERMYDDIHKPTVWSCSLWGQSPLGIRGLGASL